MIKKIDCGKTNLSDLYQVFKLKNNACLEAKKARLFPAGNTNNEVETTSIFLASLSAIKEYREELFTRLGIKKLNARNAILHAYTELSDSKTGDRPDGLLVITSGKHNPIIEWAGFIESKVNNQDITSPQIEKYVDFSRSIGINDIITISNHLVTNPTNSPIKLKKRSFKLYHWSWTYLKVTASRLVRTNSVADEDHIYILQELRRYFDAHKNLKNYEHMGANWKNAVMEIHSFSPEQKIPSELLQHIVSSYIQEEKDISLQLTDKSDYHVELIATDNHEDVICDMLQSSKMITSTFMVDRNKKNTFSIEIDFIRQKVTCYTSIVIDKGKAQAQTTALIKMFEDVAATSHILVHAYYIRKKSNNQNTSLANLIEERSQAETYSVLNKQFGDDIKSFKIKTEDLLRKDFSSVKNFVVKLESTAYRFLTQVMANKKL